VSQDSVEPPDSRVGENNSVEGVARADDRLILIFDLARVCVAASKQNLAGQ